VETVNIGGATAFYGFARARRVRALQAGDVVVVSGVIDDRLARMVRTVSVRAYRS
jgi:hypothetical protein